MTLPAHDTIVTYPDGELTRSATVLHVERTGDGSLAVLLDATPAHPVDAGWPDQGADRGTIEVNGVRLPLQDCVVGATDGAELHLGAGIPVRKGTEGWAFVVVHLLGPDAGIREGDQVVVRVDRERRRALSLGHSACHLASLALNASLAGAWTKEVPRDGAGAPDFDALAITRSTILAGEASPGAPLSAGSRDEYRIGKSLRKKGFQAAALAGDAAVRAIEAELNRRLDAAVSAGGAIRIARDGDRLTDRRYWECETGGRTVSIACGGTHARDLSELAGLRAELAVTERDGALVLVMTTSLGDGRPGSLAE